MHYEYRNGQYHLVGSRVPAPPTREIAILYSEGQLGTVLHKHGSPEDVQFHFNRMHGAFTAGGFPEEAAELKIFRSDRLPVNELNKCLEITGQVGRMIKQFERTIEGELVSEGPSP